MPPVPSRADRPRSGQGLQVHRRPPGTTARYDGRVVVRQSAGILLFRRATVAGTPEIEVLLAHPRREFSEEVGSEPPETGPGGAPPIPLGTIVQKGGKVVHAWAIEGELDADAAVSNTFEMEWPPRSGGRQVFPEIDRVAWFSPADARVRLKPTQIPFV